MTNYISGDTITTDISTIQFFPINYFNKFIKTFTSNNNLIHSMENNKISSPLIFITKIEYLDDFYEKIVKSLNTKFVLITHYGDMEAGLHNKILNHPLLIKWYGQNMCIISDKTLPIPIGLENNYWKRTNIHTIKQHSSNSKINLLYLNFSLNTNPNRSKIMDILLQKGFNKNKKLDWDHYIEDLSSHKFCISPKGNGVDCHRTWECLYLGVIPIVEKSPHMSYFHDLPILFVDSYDDISIQYLNQIYKDFKHKSFNMDKLSLSYWNRKIREHFKCPTG
uniref:Exostosin GT47 domain-containing protein n=1 Tax=viral metagenome TaxID=1070528 RepID=A0A6C0BR30_9ZZZZ